MICRWEKGFTLGASRGERLDGVLICYEHGERPTPWWGWVLRSFSCVPAGPVAVARCVRISADLDRLKPTVPHVWFAVLGRRDDSPGVGYVLLRAGQSRADRLGLPGYLETSAGPEQVQINELLGWTTPLDSPALREVVRDFAGLGLRWVKLPAALRDDENLVTSHGVASCESASRYLARRVTEAGLPATTRIGWVVGMLDLVHAWVEVTDTDGVTKVLDPIFALFATTIPGANPLLTDPTVSLRTNRLIPTGLPVGGQIATHDGDFRLSTKIQPAREAR